MTEEGFRLVFSQGVQCGAGIGSGIAAGIFVTWLCLQQARYWFLAAYREWLSRPGHKCVERIPGGGCRRCGRRVGGFTLIELLIACSILCMLMALSVSGLASVRRHCNRNISNVTKRFDDMAKNLPY